MSLDIEPSRITIQPGFHREEPIENDCPAVLDLDQSSSFDDSFRSPPPTWREPPCSNCPIDVELSTLRCENAYWRKMHQKAVERETELKQQIAELKAKLRLRERQLFGRKSEKGHNKQDSAKSEADGDKKRRGQQPGTKGHGRRDYSHLPAIEEDHDIPKSQQGCPLCGLPLVSFPGTEDSEQIEIEVKAHRRIIKRKRYKTTCSCGALPGIVTAPPPPKLIPKGIYGISVWVSVLLDKFVSLRPTYRLLADLKTHGLDMAQGTLTDDLKAITPVFVPIYEAIIAKNLEEPRWHADETRWLVFATVEGKVGYTWYMWVFLSPSVVIYTIDPSRSARVLKAHFGTVTEGILVVDRYSAYKAFVKGSNILLAFCWAHVRRDFLGVAKDWPQHATWAMQWVDDIGNLYHLNTLRLQALDQPQAFAQRDHHLRDAVEQMAHKRDAQLKEKAIGSACKKALESLKNHWKGLTVFLDHPEVPMDNNKAEQKERIPVLGRKNFYGSGAIWSGHLTAILFSIFQSLALWNINPRLWLTAFLEACALNQGNPPENIHSFLPWNMSKAKRKAFSIEPQIKDSS
jgi:transposase